MITLFNSDTFEAMQKIQDKSIDLICTDPPYGTTQIDWDSVLPLDKVWEEYKRILKPTGCVVMFGNQPFTSELILSNRKWFKQCLVWNKNKCGSPGLAKYRPMQTHEDIVVFAPGKTTYNPQMEAGEPYKRNISGKTRCNSHGYGFKNGPSVMENSGTRYPKSIINISRDFSAQQQVHPTQKPVPLLEWLVKTYSNEGDNVLDNTMGSGSTGVACVNTNRNFIGIELDPVYFEIASGRIEAANKMNQFLEV